MRTPNLDAGLTRAQAAQAIGVTRHTVSMWAIRGWYDADGSHHTLTVVGHDRRGRLYRYGDLIQAERDTRNNKKSSRYLGLLAG
jgi:hypothetical protein